MAASVTFAESGSRLIRAARLPVPSLLGVGLAYYLGAEVAFLIGTASDNIFAPFWPPNVVLFCALVFTPPDRWWLTVAAVFPAHVLAEWGVGMGTGQLVLAFAANCLVAILNAASLRWLLQGPPWFSRVRSTLAYIALTAVINPAISALAGAVGRIAGGAHWQEFWLFWSAWCLSNAIGALTLGPFILSWTGRVRDGVLRVTPWRAFEAALFVVALAAACLASLDLGDTLAGRPYVPFLLCLPLPIIIWGALRFGERAGSGGILVMTAASIWDALNQPSPFAAGSADLNVLVLQLFLIGVAVPALLLSAAVEELRQAARVARSLLGSLLRAQDDERRRIARDIHDTTAQNLIAAGLLIDGLAVVAEPASAKVRTVKDLIGQSVRELQTVSYLLHPPLLDQGGLSVALPPYIEGFSERSRVEVTLTMTTDFPRLPIDVELVVYRIVQETLSNIARHSGSKTAQVELLQYRAGTQARVRLIVTDFGIGFSNRSGDRAQLAHRGAGIGLESMRERVHQIGGRLRVNSGPGRTTVTAVIPVDV